MTTKIKPSSRFARLALLAGALALFATACEYRPEKGLVKHESEGKGGDHGAPEETQEPDPSSTENITDPGLGPTNPPPKPQGGYGLKLLAGSGARSYADGKGASAAFVQPIGIAVDADGNVVVADAGANRIRKVAKDGTVTTIAGSGEEGAANGAATDATFRGPRGVAIGVDGTIYVADTGNHLIRTIGPNGTVATLAGSPGKKGLKNAPGAGALFNAPIGIGIGPDGTLFVTEFDNHTIRVVSKDGKIVRQLAGTGVKGFKDEAALKAQFDSPVGIAVDAKGVVYVADAANNRIRKIADGKVSTLAGSRAGFKDGPGKDALLNIPYGLALAEDGNIYLTEFANNTVRRLDTKGAVTTIFASKDQQSVDSGTASPSPSPAKSKKEILQLPAGIASVGGKLYVANSGQSKIQIVAKS
ncbi:MAG TPA: hypothetical protein VM841_11580 [Actinomycetota bacterium]|nr:hypothetical protein [Actinomycetota bacterium]